MEKTTFNNFVKEVAVKTGYTQKDVKAVLQAVDDLIFDYMASGKKVRVTPSVALYSVEVSERPGRNVVTGEKVMIPARKRPKAQFSAPLKRSLM